MTGWMPSPGTGPGVRACSGTAAQAPGVGGRSVAEPSAGAPGAALGRPLPDRPARPRGAGRTGRRGPRSPPRRRAVRPDHRASPGHRPRAMGTGGPDLGGPLLRAAAHRGGGPRRDRRWPRGHIQEVDAMGVVGTLLKNRRAGEEKLAWNRPSLSARETLTLTSDAFGDGEAIPAEYAGKRAGGRNLSPQLSWSVPPAGTAELLLVVEDADAPMPRPFVHCLALIAPQVRELPPGGLTARNPAVGVRVLRSGMGRGYLGPEPIKGHGPHRYTFQLFALATAAADDRAAAEQARPRALLSAVAGPVLARGRLTGRYER